MINPNLFQALLNYSNTMKMMQPQQQQSQMAPSVASQMIASQAMPQMQQSLQTPQSMYTPQNLSAMPQLDSGMGAQQLADSIRAIRQKKATKNQNSNDSNGMPGIPDFLGGNNSNGGLLG